MRCWRSRGRSGEEVPQRLARGREREPLPRESSAVEALHFAGLLGRARLVRGAGGEDDQNDAVVGAAVDADERPELDRDVELLPDLAMSGVLDRLPEVDEAAGERPQVLAGVERAAQQDDLAGRRDRDRGDDRLGVVVRAVAAVRAGDRARVDDGRGLRAAGAEAGLVERGIEAGRFQENRSS
jgi:hypothetical protein